MSRPAANPLSPEETTRLTDFARACKAAARVVALYPATHPAIQSSLTRITESARGLFARSPARLTVLPDGLLLNEQAPERSDSAVQELAAMLHGHLIGEMTLVGEMGPAAWHTFLSLLARSAEDIRNQGGIVRAWMAAGGGPIELRQIDYGDVLRERKGALAGDWEEIVTSYLEGEFSDLDDKALAALLDIAGDTSRFRDFAERLVAQARESGERVKKDVVLLIFQALADFVARTHPEQLDRVLNQIAGVIPTMTPEMVISLITLGVPDAGGDGGGGIDLAGEIRERLSDEDVAKFVAQSVSRDQRATHRLAQAFQSLVPDADKRSALLDMAQAAAEGMPFSRQPEFPDLWKSAADLLTSYSDATWVSDEYGKELASARSHAVEVERVSDDPPERISSWLSTVSDIEVRRLDQQVLLDLLIIETRPDAWQRVLDAALSSIENLVHTGHLALAHPLLDAVITADNDGGPFADRARAGLTRLRVGSLMKHVVLVIRQSRDDEVTTIAEFCRALGPTAIKPLADALAVEHGSAVKRFRDVLLSFGAAGRDYVDELRGSANPTVRRTAVDLLRAFGGAEALPDLKALIGDAEPAVQREALRAIMQIGTDEAYETLADAIKSGEPQARSTIMQVLSSSHDERAAPLFIYILDHTDHRGAFEAVYRLAVESLGHLGGDTASVDALKKLLYRGEWWAPGRTRRLRDAAAAALRACGSLASQQTLEQAAHDGPGGVRRAAKAALDEPAPRDGTEDQLMEGSRLRFGEDAVRRLAAAVRSAQLYAPGHPLVHRSLEALAEVVGQLVADRPSVAIGLIGQAIVVGETPLAKAAESYSELIRRLQALGIERIAFERGVTPEELTTLVLTLAHPERTPGETAAGAAPADALTTLQGLQYIRVGRISLDERVDTSAADVATIRRLYTDAVGVAQTLWDLTLREGRPDPDEARELIDNLAQAVAQNRTALVALTALKEYDNYTFTHMVNVSILTMAQARALSVEGALLREFGLAALMHDIGKVRTPIELLHKPDKLTDDEFGILRMHVVDGAEILRRTPDIPALAPVVAFEHHLRLDGTGYPVGVNRSKLNLGTMLCSIADVYDAMRSQRAYQESFPTDRIISVLKRNDGLQFDQHLVRRFSQLMGIYPPGNMVRLDNGEIAVVLRIYAPDPGRPRVRVVLGPDGAKLARPRDVNLWESTETSAGPTAILSPVDPSTLGIDPLTYL